MSEAQRRRMRMFQKEKEGWARDRTSKFRQRKVERKDRYRRPSPGSEDYNEG